MSIFYLLRFAFAFAVAETKIGLSIDFSLSKVKIV